MELSITIMQHFSVFILLVFTWCTTVCGATFIQKKKEFLLLRAIYWSFLSRMCYSNIEKEREKNPTGLSINN